MNRVGQVWDIGHDMVVLVIASRIHEVTGNWVHSILFLCGNDGGLLTSIATDELFNDGNLKISKRIA